jgi:hypothetical protein
LGVCYSFAGWVFFCVVIAALLVLLFFFCNFFFQLEVKALPFNPLSILAPNATLGFLLALSIFFFFNAVVLVSLGAVLCLLYFFSNKSFFGKSVIRNDVVCGVISNLANSRVGGLSSYTFFFFNTLANVTRSVDGLLRFKLGNFLSGLQHRSVQTTVFQNSSTAPSSRFPAL